MTRMEMLRAIEAADPAGRPEEPTEEMYAAHKQWAIEAFGLVVWQHYVQGGWGEHSDV